MSFSDKIGKLNDALFPTNPSKETDQRLGVFGGESFGFAHGVDAEDCVPSNLLASALILIAPLPISNFFAALKH